jgi:hypothetical protein
MSTHNSIAHRFIITALSIVSIVTATAQSQPVTATTAPPPALPVRPLPPAYPAGLALNRVVTLEAVAPFSDTAGMMHKPLSAVKQAIVYADGLGRTIQTVLRQGSPAGGDVVGLKRYDDYGREVVQYLPYTTSTATGAFKPNGFAEQAAQIAVQYPGEQVGYGETIVEASPLDRVLKTMAPGNSWAGSGRGVSRVYDFNTIADSVMRWNSDGDYPVPMGYYAAGLLQKIIQTDEDGKTVVEYTNREGQVVLKKVSVGSPAGVGNTAYINWLATLYIYDDFGRPWYVVQPVGVAALAATGWQFTTAIREEQCFISVYDASGRLISRKVPGAGWVQQVFDARDRLVLYQGAGLAAKGKWGYTQYDAQNRVIATGLWVNSSSAATHRQQAAGSTSYPVLTTGVEELSHTYYDDYSYTGVLAFDDSYATALPAGSNANSDYTGRSHNTAGMVTGSRLKVQGSNQYLTTTTWYDTRGRPLQVLSQNHRGGVDVLTTLYDWQGKVLSTLLHHRNPASSATPELRITTAMRYDAGGRLIETTQRIQRSATDPAPAKVIARLVYNAQGQLQQKQLGTTGGGSAPLETLAFDYNIRGWLTAINGGYARGSDEAHYFGQVLAYNSGFTQASYNGNIAGLQWRARGDGEQRAYSFAYDGANR